MTSHNYCSVILTADFNNVEKERDTYRLPDWLILEMACNKKICPGKAMLLLENGSGWCLNNGCPTIELKRSSSMVLTYFCLQLLFFTNYLKNFCKYFRNYEYVQHQSKSFNKYR